MCQKPVCTLAAVYHNTENTQRQGVRTCSVCGSADTDEPLLSGSGSVSKEVKDCNLLEAWAEVLTRWHSNLAVRPKQVTGLVRKGIPEALRGEVWQLLAGAQDVTELLEAYRILITKVGGWVCPAAEVGGRMWQR